MTTKCAAHAYIDKLSALVAEAPPEVKLLVLAVAEGAEGMHVEWSCCEKCAFNMLDDARDYVSAIIEEIENEQPSAVN